MAKIKRNPIPWQNEKTLSDLFKGVSALYSTHGPGERRFRDGAVTLGSVYAMCLTQGLGERPQAVYVFRRYQELLPLRYRMPKALQNIMEKALAGEPLRDRPGRPRWGGYHGANTKEQVAKFVHDCIVNQHLKPYPAYRAAAEQFNLGFTTVAIYYRTIKKSSPDLLAVNTRS